MPNDKLTVEVLEEKLNQLATTLQSRIDVMTDRIKTLEDRLENYQEAFDGVFDDISELRAHQDRHIGGIAPKRMTEAEIAKMEVDLKDAKRINRNG